MKNPDPTTPTSVKFKSPTKLGLKEALKTAVDEYFEREHIPKTGTFKLFSKTIILFIMLIGVYSAILSLEPYTLFNIKIPVFLYVFLFVTLYALLGLIFASIGVNVIVWVQSQSCWWKSTLLERKTQHCPSHVHKRTQTR